MANLNGNIYTEAKGQPPMNPDMGSSAPDGYKHYLDALGGDPFKNIKEKIRGIYPSISDVLIFHEAKTNIGGNVIIRMNYKGNIVDKKYTDQQIRDTITNQKEGDLAPYLQNLSVTERGIFNLVNRFIQEKNKAEKVASNPRDYPNIPNLYNV